MFKNVKTQKILGFLLGAALTLLVGYTVLHSLGYRIVNGYKIKKVGTVEITLPITNTNIFIDKSKKIVTKKDNETVVEKLSPEQHMIIVAKDSYFPWKKDFTVVSKENVKLNPIFVSQNPSGNIITTKDPEYYSLKYSIDSNYPPTKFNPKISNDKSVSIWAEEGEIFAKRNDETFSVVKTDNKVKNLEFYKDRNDVVMFSSGLGVFVIEIDKAGGQNFMPIYKGHEPTFKGGDPNFIYIFDFGALMQVVI